nr:putative receptor-like protein kinase At4g00960 [Oryza sativa Japonica Group]
MLRDGEEPDYDKKDFMKFARRCGATSTSAGSWRSTWKRSGGSCITWRGTTRGSPPRWRSWRGRSGRPSCSSPPARPAATSAASSAAPRSPSSSSASRRRSTSTSRLQLFPVITCIYTTSVFSRRLDSAPHTQNLRSSPSNRSARASRWSNGDEDYTYSERPQARTEPIAVATREDKSGHHNLNKDGVDKASSSNDDIGHLLTPAHQAAGFSLFDLFRIVDATDNFSLENKIGEGGFGRVYKGQLNGLPVAVKRCFVESSPERLSDFENEIKFIPRLQHRNIVTLKGYCIEGKERILVYEYMQNKSLDKFIFGPRTDWSLYWDRLFAIIEGIAQGIVYLHLHSGLKIIHRDLKLSNILLDSEMNPKISDFGTARSGFPNKGRRTDTVSGTYGYMAPEYSTRGIFSGKSDVFSFGSLLLEIVSGKRNGTWYSIRERKSISLHEYAWRLVFEEKNPERLIRSSLRISVGGDAPHLMGQIVGCAHIALLCVQEDPEDRPSMWDVVLMLHGGVAALSALPTPKQPARRYGGGREQRPKFREVLANGHDWDKKTVTVLMR